MAIRSISLSNPLRVSAVVPSNSDVIKDWTALTGANQVSITAVDSDPLTGTPSQQWYIPVAHNPDRPDHWSSIMNSDVEGLSAAYTLAHTHDGIGSNSAIVDSAVLANFFNVPPESIAFWLQDHPISGFYKVATWAACTGVPAGSISELKARAHWLWLGINDIQDISARAIWDYTGKPVGMFPSGFSTSGMAFYIFNT
jgi:hypothetical protein